MFHTARRAAHIGRVALAAGALRWSEGERREAARRALAALMAEGRGVPMKIGQFLADTEAGEAFRPLTEGVEPLPIEVIRPEVEAALGAPLESLFNEFSSRGIGASLGQVHRAQLRTGEEVAVKVRYPGIGEAVEAEMRLARLLPGVGPVRTWGFDLDGYKRVLRDNMALELDYRSELERQSRFRSRMNVSGLVIPAVYPDCSWENVLTQGWEEGVALDAVGSWPVEERRHVAAILMCSLFQGLFLHGEIHGDPHSGNYRFRRGALGTPEVILLDYGCTVPIAREARLALVRLIAGALDRDGTEPAACFAAMGFDPAKLAHIQPILPALSEVLLEPFLQSTPFRLASWELRARVDRLLGELKWWFRAAGPPELLLLIRAFRGLVSQLESLAVAMPWRAVFQRVVPAEVIAEARALPLPPVSGEAPFTFAGMARYLRVEVMEGPATVASVTLPAGQTAVIETLIPEETLARIREARIDLEDIKRRALSSGLGPRELFAFRSGAKAYRVWLE